MGNLAGPSNVLTAVSQRAVLSSLVANVATAYFQLRALDSELEISKHTMASRQESLKLTQFLESHGSNSGLDVSRPEQLVYTASETIPDLERQIQQQENVLSVLLGENPQSIPRGHLYALAERHPEFEPACIPPMSAICIRFKGAGLNEAESKDLHAEVAQRVARSGPSGYQPLSSKAKPGFASIW